MAQSSFEYGDETPAGWDPGVYRRQEGRGHGVSMKAGPKPPEADEVAPRGTPAWRAAWTRMQNWIQENLFRGATLGDMGFTREHEHGKQQFLRLSRGEYGGFRPDWFEGSKGHGRFYVDPYTGMMRPIAGSGGPFGSPQSLTPTMAPPPPTTGLRSSGAPTTPFAPVARPYAPAAPTNAPGATAAPSETSLTASDVYMQNPRGGRKKLAGFGSTPNYRANATLIRRYPNG